MQEKEEGPCRAVLKRFYYDVDHQQCRQFTYGGCRGNRNNFETYDECAMACEVKSEFVFRFVFWFFGFGCGGWVCVFFYYYYSCLDALFGCVFVDVAFTCLIDLANSFPLVSPIQLVRLCPRKYSDFLIK